MLYNTAQATLRWGMDDTFIQGVIPLPVIQKYFNYWAPKIYDLFGDDDSERAYDLFRAGIRIPRNFVEDEEATIHIDTRVGDGVMQTEVSAQWATNTIMRRQFIAEIKRTVDRWNLYLQRMGIDFRLYLPHERFGRSYGPCAGLPFDANGNMMRGEAEIKYAEYLPTTRERANVRSLMQRELSAERFASWIAPSATASRARLT